MPASRDTGPALSRLTSVIGLALIALALAPTAAAKAPPPEQQMDTAAAVGQVDDSDFIPGPEFTNIDIDVRSGPSGEDPSGTISFDYCVFVRGECVYFNANGSATCLNVTGDRAVIGFRAGGTFDLGPAVVTLVDGGGHGADRFRTEPVGGSTPDCSQALSSLSPLDGHADVFDGQPLPTMKDQCKSGGWRQWDFKNQGRCVSFVNDK